MVGAIETRSLPNSLAAARRGFTFYLADPLGLIDHNRLGGSGEPPLPGKNRSPFVSCSGRRACHAEAPRRRVACIATLVLAAGAAASTGEILPDSELLATNLYRRWRRDDALLSGSIGDRINHPPPARMAIFVDRPRCTAAIEDLHSPVKVIGRNCEHQRDRSHDHYSAQHSHQK